MVNVFLSGPYKPNTQFPHRGHYHIYNWPSKKHIPTLLLPDKAWSFWTLESPKLKGITLLYNLPPKSIFIKTLALKRWERDLQSVFSDYQWQQAITYNYKVFKCVNYWELSQKIHHRWYLTPVQMYKFANLDNNHCRWACSHIGTFTHILWECPHINPLWNKVFTFFSEMTGVITKLTPSLALFSLSPQHLRC